MNLPHPIRNRRAAAEPAPAAKAGGARQLLIARQLAQLLAHPQVAASAHALALLLLVVLALVLALSSLGGTA